MKAAAQTLVAAPSLRRRQELSRDDLIARGVLVAVMSFLVFFLLAPMAAIFVRAVQDDDGRFVGFAHFAGYLGTPALLSSVWNSVWVAAAVVAISVPLAFAFAYALTRSCASFKNTFRLIANESTVQTASTPRCGPSVVREVSP